MISKICLGTAQFGLDYGIANQNGKVAREEVFKILKYAQDSKLNALDTSVAYGDGESVIGEYISESNTLFDIVTKILIDADSIEVKEVVDKLKESLKKLKIKQLNGCLIHRFEDFQKHDQLWNGLVDSKKEGLVDKIGFSLYFPEELEEIWDKGINFDIIQIPFSVFDQRFEKYLNRLKKANVEVCVRSVFLQGLVFLKLDQLPDHLYVATKSLNQLHKISNKYDLSINALCLNFATSNDLIDKVVIGVDSLDQLRNNVQDLEGFEKVTTLKNELRDLAILDEEVLLPFKWGQKNENS